MQRTHTPRTVVPFTRAAVVLVALLLWGCPESESFFYAERVTDLEFELCDETMGVHPSATVIECGSNPFRNGLGDDTKWEVNTAGGPVAAFYGWASLLVFQPTGEHQYYAALSAKEMYENGLAAQADLETVREIAIGGFQSVLDNFPESVSIDRSESFAFGLATPSYIALEELGARVQGGWFLVETENGGVQAVRIGQDPFTPPGEEEGE